MDSGYACIRRYLFAQNRKPLGSAKKCPPLSISGKMRTYFRRGPHLKWGRRSKYYKFCIYANKKEKIARIRAIFLFLALGVSPALGRRLPVRVSRGSSSWWYVRPGYPSARRTPLCRQPSSRGLWRALLPQQIRLRICRVLPSRSQRVRSDDRTCLHCGCRGWYSWGWWSPPQE